MCIKSVNEIVILLEFLAITPVEAQQIVKKCERAVYICKNKITLASCAAQSVSDEAQVYLPNATNSQGP